MSSIRTDLAVEARQLYQEKGTGKIEVPGADVNIYEYPHVNVTTVKINNEEGAREMGKPIGNYITLEAKDIKQNIKETYDQLRDILSEELGKIININDESTILIVGLGNWNITPDSLGPKVVSNIMVTRHLHEYMPEEIEKGVRSTCAISPGVLGITGVETGEIIKGVVENIKPDLIIAIDALASRSVDRVSTTIQITDTGISPGSGVGNDRKEFTQHSMGVPVIALGVPTVVDAATIASDSIDKVISSLMQQSSSGKEFYGMLNSVDKDEKYKLIQQVLGEDMANLLVTPKEIDEIIDKISAVIAEGINIALHTVITPENVANYTLVN